MAYPYFKQRLAISASNANLASNIASLVAFAHDGRAQNAWDSTQQQGITNFTQKPL
jgi:hypothetical protein